MTQPPGPRIGRPTEGLSRPAGHYSPVTTGAGLVFVSGQLPVDRDGKAHPDASLEAQAELTLDNVSRALRAAGCGWEDVLKVTVYLAGVEHWPAFNAVYARVLGEVRPARAIVPVPELHHGVLVEVEAVALAPAEPDRTNAQAREPA